LVYDANTGEVRDDKKFMSMLEDFWLPRREGSQGTQIDTLPAGQNLGEIGDIEYFQKKLYQIHYIYDLDLFLSSYFFLYFLVILF
jgi:hypothetical protein